jgi:pimeloyl-CoA synthetase
MIETPKKVVVIALLQDRPELKFVQIAALAQCSTHYVCQLAKDLGIVNSNRYVGGYINTRHQRHRRYLPIIPIEKDEDGRLRPVI